MMTRLRPRRPVLTLMLFAWAALLPLSMQSDAFAQAAPPAAAPTGTPVQNDISTTDSNGAIKTCNSLAEVQGGKLLGKIVPCMIYTINESTVKFTEKMVAAFRPLLLTFLLLVVVLFGVRLLSQEPQISKQGFLLLVKIAIVAILLGDLGNSAAYDGSGSQGKIIPTVYNIMRDSQAIVAGAIDTSKISCNVADFAGPKTPKVWATMDCVLGKLYGFTTGTDPNTGQPSTNMLLVASFFGLMSGFFFGGAWGVTIFLGMLGVLFSIFVLVVRMAVSFISSYLVICLMLIMSPLLMPLAFMKITTQYFDSFWRLILASFLTPVILTAYCMFSIMIYDKVLFDPKSAIQSLFKYEDIKAALQPPRPACAHPITNNPTDVRLSQTNPTAADIAKKFTSPFLQNNVIPTLSGANDPCAPFSITPLDESKINGFIDGTGPNSSANRKEAFTKIFEQLLSMFIIAYLLHQGLGLLSSLINQITGKRSAIVAADGIVGRNLDLEQRGRDAYNSAISRFRTSDGASTYKSGAEFLTGLPRDGAAAASDAASIFATGRRPGEPRQ